MSVSTTAEQIDQANATDRSPVVFIHGLWLLPSSWDRWAAVFDEAGYTALTRDGRMIPTRWRRRKPALRSSPTRRLDRWPTTMPA